MKRGEIYYLDLGEFSIGSIQHGIRPVIVVQNNTGNKFSTTTLVCPLTSKEKRDLPTHVKLTPDEDGVKVESIVLCEQCFTVDKQMLRKKVGEISNKKIEELNSCLKVSFEI